MQVKLTIVSYDLTEQEVLSLFRSIRLCEREEFPKKILGILVETTPKLSSGDALRLLTQGGASFDQAYGSELESGVRVVDLGPREMWLRAQLIGLCDKMVVTVAEATEEELERLRNARVISLVRPGRG